MSEPKRNKRLTNSGVFTGANYEYRSAFILFSLYIEHYLIKNMNFIITTYRPYLQLFHNICIQLFGLSVRN